MSIRSTCPLRLHEEFPHLTFVFFVVEKIPCEDKEDKDISKLVSGIVKCSINRQISYKTVGPNEVCIYSKHI